MPFPVQNHKGRYFLKYKFTDTATGDEFFSTNWLEGGKQYSYRVIGSSAESHISHVLSGKMSLRPMGWSREGADSLSQIRIYWKNGRDMLKLVQKEEMAQESREEEKYLSASEILAWEKKTSKVNGKYIEALRAHISNPISGKLNFYNAIANIC